MVKEMRSVVEPREQALPLMASGGSLQSDRRVSKVDARVSSLHLAGILLATHRTPLDRAHPECPEIMHFKIIFQMYFFKNN